MTHLTKAQQLERDNAIETLRKLCPPGTTIRTIVRHVSRSGMMRHIDAYVIQDNHPVWISGRIAAAGIGGGQADSGAIKMVGCGMDMAFALVYELSHVLYQDGFDCIGDQCPSNDHSNYRGDNREQCPTHHTDGGYALRQSAL